MRIEGKLPEAFQRGRRVHAARVLSEAEATCRDGSLPQVHNPFSPAIRPFPFRVLLPLCGAACPHEDLSDDVKLLAKITELAACGSCMRSPIDIAE